MQLAMFVAAEKAPPGGDAFVFRLMDAAMGALDHVFRLRSRPLRCAMPEQGMDDKEYDSQQDDFSHPANITKRDRKGKATNVLERFSVSGETIMMFFRVLK